MVIPIPIASPIARQREDARVSQMFADEREVSRLGLRAREIIAWRRARNRRKAARRVRRAKGAM